MSTETISYPVAETFHSIQGEGLWAGAQMFFIRLAGCPVGRYEGSQVYSTCTTIDEQKFECDTDYRKRKMIPLTELVEECWEQHVCLTGGEPLIHALQPLLDAFAAKGISCHIETSGTIPIPMRVAHDAFITCSPKAGFLSENFSRVDQWKFVIGPHTDLGTIGEFLKNNHLDHQPVYFQPLGQVDTFDKAWAKAVLELMKVFPEARLSLQLHKVLGLR